LAPARRASESPIAIACFRFFTFFPERPLLSVPRLRSRITFPTFLDASLLYLAMIPDPDVAFSKNIDGNRTQELQGSIENGRFRRSQGCNRFPAARKNALRSPVWRRKNSNMANRVS